MTTIQAFIVNNNITMRLNGPFRERTDKMQDWIPGSSHWKVTLKRGRKSFTLWYTMGPAHTNDPSLAEILDCLGMDVSSVLNNNSFEEWCRDFGYDTDSRKAESIYKAIEKQYNNLIRLLGSEDKVKQLAFEIERL